MKVLSGWKEIANHLHQAVRTVQRWELLGLPIHRNNSRIKGAVIAFAEELDSWQLATPTRNFDVFRDLKTKIDSLEVQVRSLKRQNSRIRGKFRKERKVA